MVKTRAVANSKLIDYYYNKVNVDELIASRYENIVKRTLKNSLFLACTSSVLFATLCVITRTNLAYLPLKIYVPLMGICGVAGLLLMVKYRYHIWYEFSLGKLIRANAKGRYQWWHRIDEKRTLSAIPTYSHLKTMLQTVAPQGNLAVVSLTKSFETEKPGIVKAADWKVLKVPHLQIQVFDFKPLSVQQLTTVETWVEARRKEGFHVLYHCKGGKARSAMTCVSDIIREKYQSISMWNSRTIASTQMANLKKIRSAARLNTRQHAELSRYVDSLKERQSQQLQEELNAER